MNSFSDNSEWMYHFKNSIDWKTILPLYYPSFPTEDGYQNMEEAIKSFEELVSSIADWSTNTLFPRAKELDHTGAGELKDGNTIVGPVLMQTYKEAEELGYHSLFVDKKYGGQGLPVILGSVMFTHIFRADLATGTQLGFFSSISDMVERFCDDADKERLLPLFAQGKISGCMCLTEPGAGSDVGSLRTSAVKQADGTYLINGSKIFITNGGGGVAFVLARIKDAPKGLEGISLFLVEQANKNYRVAKVEEKMGFHGSFTCELVFENSKGKLIGKENEGFKYMLHLMNEARLAVGYQCLGGMEACLEYAKNYAATRVQFGKPIAELPLMQRNLKDWQVEVDAYRAFIIDTMSYYDIYQKLDLKKRHHGELNDEDKKLLKHATKWVRRRTPLVKYYGAESFTLYSQRCIQALGGYGFMKEYEAERMHRDSFAPLLYEGTSQIQSLMALKDLLKYVMKNPTKYVQSIIGDHPLSNIMKTPIQKEFSALHYEFKKNFMSLLIRNLKPNIDLTNFDQVKEFLTNQKWVDEERMNKVLIHAETITQALSYIETLRVLCRQAVKDQSREKLFYQYKNLVTPRILGIFTDWELR
jgi:alkylation response protein AidB-like acyl-CoA dehydrogenase